MSVPPARINREDTLRYILRDATSDAPAPRPVLFFLHGYDEGASKNIEDALTRTGRYAPGIRTARCATLSSSFHRCRCAPMFGSVTLPTRSQPSRFSLRRARRRGAAAAGVAKKSGAERISGSLALLRAALELWETKHGCAQTRSVWKRHAACEAE